ALATTCAIVTGTMVTGSGPHAGDENAIRLGFEIRDIARVHSASVWVALGVLLLIIQKVRKSPSSVLYREVSLVLGAFVAQGFVGYVQYFSGIPAALVALHIAGSVAVTVTTTNLVASLLDRTASASA
ncbi:MAG: heme A synthase, partial [Actinobacteria bacterium]|nr:heme A synthase [Actinomycetota bacterium]